MKFECASCKQHLEADPEMAGLKVVCPACEQTIVIPSDDSITAPVGDELEMSVMPPAASHSQGGAIDQTMLEGGSVDAPARPGVAGTVDRFEIIKQLGEGGMGRVFLAREPTTGSKVAIKLMKPELAFQTRMRRSFLTEARHMYNLSHPNILRVLEVRDRDEGPYYVMPFVSGGSLVDLLSDEEPLPYEQTLKIIRQVAAALTHAHAKGLIHRDLKPGNVLLDEDGRAYLTDFGLVRTVYNDSMLYTEESQCQGTPAYMSPSVAAGNAEDTRCDIYGLGAMLYEMLTGQAPYRGPTPDSVVRQVVAGPPKPILEVNPKAHKGLVKIAERAMARELRDRYAEMKDVLSDLDMIETGKKPRVKASKSVAIKLPRLSAKHRKPLLAGVLLIAVSAATLLGFRQLSKPNTMVIEGLGLEMIRVDPGTFLMGSPTSEAGREADETQHTVTITKPYWLGKYEVTQGEWQAVMGSNPSTFIGDNRLPVEQVSWNDAMEFCRKVTAAERAARRLPEGYVYTLPTEAQWEYACRAGSTGAYAGELDATAWYDRNSANKTHPVGVKQANAWGFHDMHGNVWEWCWDWGGDYPNVSTINPQGSAQGTNRVNRGGSWNLSASVSRSAERNSSGPDYQHFNLGFRLCLAPSAKIHENAVNYRGHHYLLVTGRISWSAAKTACEDVGGHLVSIGSEDENHFVSKLIGPHRVWIGLYRDSDSKKFKWVDNTEFKYTAWHPGEPNNQNNNFGDMYGGHNWAVRVDDWSANAGYVCEWDKAGFDGLDRPLNGGNTSPTSVSGPNVESNNVQGVQVQAHSAASQAANHTTAGIRYVSLDGSHSEPYTNWRTAATNIQAAVDAASPGDTVLVGPGRYLLDSTVTITNKPLLLKGEKGRDVTILDGQRKVLCLNLSGTNVLAEGLTLTRGCGGVVVASNAVLRDCTISECSIGGLYQTGAGVIATSGSLIEDCLIVKNRSARGSGGGLRIDGNARASRCIITDNSAESWRGNGGGVVAGDSILENCLITHNRSYGNDGGGGIFVRGGAKMLARNCTIVGNIAHGGYKNGGYFVSGVFVQSRASATLINSVLYGELTSSGTAITGAKPETAPASTNQPTNVSVYYLGDVRFLYSCLPDPVAGDGNITNAPLFVDPENGDFRMSAESPCIDAGTNELWMTTALDLGGNPRINGGRADIGAYESSSSSASLHQTQPQPPAGPAPVAAITSDTGSNNVQEIELSDFDGSEEVVTFGNSAHGVGNPYTIQGITIKMGDGKHKGVDVRDATSCFDNIPGASLQGAYATGFATATVEINFNGKAVNKAGVLLCSVDGAGTFELKAYGSEGNLLGSVSRTQPASSEAVFLGLRSDSTIARLEFKRTGSPNGFRHSNLLDDIRFAGSTGDADPDTEIKR